VSAAATVMATDAGAHAKFVYVLRLADASLILGQQLGALIGHSPAIEQDLGLANISLDLIGQARLLLTYAGEIEGANRDEDQLAFLRSESEFYNPTLVEQPNTDFAFVIARQLLMDAWQLELYDQLAQGTDTRLAEIAAKSLKETKYHFGYSADWAIRLGDGTEESHQRMQRALDALWPYTYELFDPDEIDLEISRAGIAGDLSSVRQNWDRRVNEVLEQATLKRPENRFYSWYGKRGQHSEHLGRVLAEMQYLQRTYPGAQW
jgi:ring-1,2-phenylacetyl-CoA epoxidase subunit PaaC